MDTNYRPGLGKRQSVKVDDETREDSDSPPRHGDTKPNPWRCAPLIVASNSGCGCVSTMR